MGISKEKFVKVMERLKAVDDFGDHLHMFIEGYQDVIHNDFMDGFGLFVTNNEIVIQLLELLTHDKDGDILYFMYELDYGRKYHPGCVTYKGNNVDLSDAEHLYDWLERQEKERTKK